MLKWVVCPDLLSEQLSKVFHELVLRSQRRFYPVAAQSLVGYLESSKVTLWVAG